MKSKSQVSSLCLFILLGGSAYAATTIGSKQVADNSIQSKDIKNGSVTGKDVKKKSLTAALFKAGQLPRGATGATGPRGDQGPTGVQGPGAPVAFAAVTYTGESSFSRGVVATTKAATGQYNVQFARSVDGCAPLASQGYAKPAGPHSVASSGITLSVLASNAPNSVQVYTSSGQTATDASFIVALFC